MPATLFHLRTALCRELTPGETAAPAWVELIPAGPDIVGLDGRRFRMAAPQLVVERFAKTGLKRPIDWEHATQIKGAQGERAAAAAWIEQLEVRDGAIWGRVTWTDAGAADVQSRAYKYLSPGFTHDKDRNVLELVSAGLTNSPNLVMASLNREGAAESVMPPELLKLLGLTEKATTEEALSAVNKMKGDLSIALNRAETPSLEKFVPRADYDLAVNRAKAADDALAKVRTEQLVKEVDAELEAASKAGTIVPASVAYHRAQCLTDGGLARFREFAKTAPVVAPDSKLDGKAPPAAQNVALNSNQQAITNKLGLTTEQFVQARG